MKQNRIFDQKRSLTLYSIVSHSPILLGMPDAEIFSFDNGTIHPCQYEDADSYVITKTFVNSKKPYFHPFKR